MSQEAAHADAEALRRRLLEGDAVRRAASWLDARPQLWREMFTRGGPTAELEAWARSIDIVDLLRACLVALRVPALSRCLHARSATAVARFGRAGAHHAPARG